MLASNEMLLGNVTNVGGENGKELFRAAASQLVLSRTWAEINECNV